VTEERGSFAEQRGAQLVRCQVTVLRGLFVGRQLVDETDHGVDVRLADAADSAVWQRNSG
jgi:hypothetical protein